MRFENTRTFNFEGALRGMRNPLNSWAKSDSAYGIGDFDDIVVDIDDAMFLYNQEAPFQNDEEEELLNSYLWENARNYSDNDWNEYAVIGPKDMNLAKRLIAGGSEHRKFLRQIFVSVDITAPLYIWKEFDTYKVGTTANSTSTMHKLASTPITLDCFETDDYDDSITYCYPNVEGSILDMSVGAFAEDLITDLEALRQKYLETKDKRYWKELVRWLPNGWLQTRTWTANYEVLRTMYHQRKGHKLTEWAAFCEWVETLPYAKEFIID